MTHLIHFMVTAKTYLLVLILAMLFLIDTQRATLDIASVFKFMQLMMWAVIMESLYIIVMTFNEMRKTWKNKRDKIQDHCNDIEGSMEIK